MPNLQDNPEFTANEVNAIQGTDRLSGQFAGAEFGGIGNLNQAAQKLANRTAYLNARQLTNIANIASLLGFMGKFGSQVSPSGIVLWVPVTDVALGSITLMLQAGVYAPSGGIAVPASFAVPFLQNFPNACEVVIAQVAAVAGTTASGGGVSACSVDSPAANGSFTCNAGYSSGSGVIGGITWFAGGY